MPFGLRLNVPGDMLTTSAKSETGDVKFRMNVGLISVLAEKASRTLPEGDDWVAIETEDSTLTVSERNGSFNVMAILRADASLATVKPAVVEGAKPAAVTSAL